MKTREQFGVIPISPKHERKAQVLLITSRDTHRWIVPKGWPMRHLSPARAAAREAFEEAGVTGNVSRKAMGSYNYQKRLKTGGAIPCRVTLFLLYVTNELYRWPEKKQRRRQWFAPEIAASLVEEPELANLLRSIGDTV